MAIDRYNGMYVYIYDSTMNCDLYVRIGKYHLLDAENILCNVSRKWSFIGSIYMNDGILNSNKKL